MSNRYDVIVIGAGPAGSSAAKKCADFGLKTILIEKNTIPRVKPCGGGVSDKALKLIETKIPSTLIEQKVKGFRFFSPSLNSVDLVSNQIVGISTVRDKFDAFLTRLAVEAGSELIQSDGVIDLSTNPDNISCKLRSGRTVYGKIVIGADGANGIASKKTGIRQRWEKTETGLCLESSLPLSPNDMKKIDLEIFELYFIEIPLGYGWLFPKKTSISIGVGGALAYLDDPSKVFRNFCKLISDTKKIKLKIKSYNAHLAPAGGFKRKVVSERAVLVGDAAGFIDPLTGEGIYYAIKSGQIASIA